MITYLGVSRVGFRYHFEWFLVALGSSLVVFESTGRRSEFPWIRDPPWETPG